MTVKALGLLTLGLAASMAANAQSETLVYTGSNVTYVAADGPFEVSGNINGSITIGAPLADNLSFATVTPTAFSFNGGTPLSDTLGAFGIFEFSTDATGLITGWQFGLQGSSGTNPAVTLTEASFGNAGDSIQLDYTGQDGVPHEPIGVVLTPGTWSVSTVAAPEIDPTSAISGLMLLLGSLAVMRGRSKAV